MKPASRASRLEWGFRAVLVMLVILWMLYPPQSRARITAEVPREAKTL